MRFSARSFADACRAAASCASVAGSADLGAVPCACRKVAQANVMLQGQMTARSSAGACTQSLPVPPMSPTLMGRASSVRPRPPRRKRSGEEQHTCEWNMQHWLPGQLAPVPRAKDYSRPVMQQHHLRPAATKGQPCAIGRRVQPPQLLVACPRLTPCWAREPRRQAELVAFAISKRLQSVSRQPQHAESPCRNCAMLSSCHVS
jgi:hypothetical protein